MDHSSRPPTSPTPALIPGPITYPLISPKYHLIETRRPLTEVPWVAQVDLNRPWRAFWGSLASRRLDLVTFPRNLLWPPQYGPFPTSIRGSEAWAPVLEVAHDGCYNGFIMRVRIGVTAYGGLQKVGIYRFRMIDAGCPPSSVF